MDLSRPAPGPDSSRSLPSLLAEAVSACQALHRRGATGCTGTVLAEILASDLRGRGLRCRVPLSGLPPTRAGRDPRPLHASSFALVIEERLAIEFLPSGEAPSGLLARLSGKLRRQGLEAGLLADFARPDPSAFLWIARAGLPAQDEPMTLALAGIN